MKNLVKKYLVIQLIIFSLICSTTVMAKDLKNNNLEKNPYQFDNYVGQIINSTKYLALETDGNQDLGIPDVNIKINGQDYEKGMEYHENVPVEVTFKWTENDNWGTLREFTYPLGDFLATSSQGGPIIDDNNQTIGNWSISEDGQNIIFNFDGTFGHESTQERYFTLKLKGIIPLDPEKNQNNQDNSFQIGEENVTLKPTYDETTIELTKEMSSIEVNEDGKLISHVMIEAFVDGWAKDIVICDTLGSSLSVSGDISVINENNESINSEKVKCSHGGSFDIKIPGPITLDENEANTKIVISYDVILTAGAVGQWYKNQDSDILSNKANGTFTDPIEEKSIPEVTSTLKPNNIFNLRKNGTLDGNKIVWSITFTSSIELTVDVISQLGMGDFSFVDSLGDGLSYLGDLDFKNITLDQFEKSQRNNDGTWVYSLTYETEITNENQEQFENTITSNNIPDITNTGRVTKTDGVGKLAINKEFIGTEEATDKMNWTISVDIPDDGWDEITITDTPKNDFDNKTGFSHKVVEESVKVIVDETEYSSPVDFTLDYNTGEYGFLIIANSTANVNFVNAIAGKTIKITLQTEATTDEGSKDGSLSGNYNWENEANVSLSYSSSRPDSSRTSSAFNTATGKPDFIKSVVDEKKEGVFTWRILITGDPFVNYNSSGCTGNFNTLDVKITDYLPDGLKLKGEPYAILYYSNRSEGDHYLDSFRNILSTHIIYTNDGTLNIEWKDKGNLKEELDSFPKENFEGFNNTDYYLVICYQTELDKSSDALKDKSGKVTFSNRADGSINGEIIGPTIANQDYELKSALEKSYIYDLKEIPNFDSDFATTNGNYNVKYIIDVNPEKLVVDATKSSTISLVDTMGQSLTPILSSINLVDVDTGEVLPNSQYYRSFDEDSNKLTLRIPDGRHFILTYYAILNEKDIDNKTADTGNKIELFGLGSTKTQEVKGPTAVLKPSASAGSGSTTISVFKYTNDTPEGFEFLSGAEYELYPVLYQNGEFIKDTSDLIGDRVVNGAVDEKDPSKTNFTFDINLSDESTFHSNHIFCLKETKAPYGFILDETPIYFIFSTYDDTNNIDELKAAGVEVYDLGEWIYFENNKDEGDLVVSKIVSGDAGNKDQEFDFTVTLGDKNINGQYGDMVFENGVATFTLKHGESKIAKGLYSDLAYEYSYKVVETDSNQDGYLTTSTGTSGTIKADSIAVAKFVNTKNLERTNLTLTKNVEGLNGQNKTYKFYITGPQVVAGKSFEITLDNRLTFNEATPPVAEINIDANASITINNLPVGTYYISEDETSAEIPGYTWTADNPKDINLDTSNNEVTITNTYIKEENNLGSLKIKKNVEGLPSEITQDKEFDFTITGPNEAKEQTFGELQFDNSEPPKAEFKLKANEEKLFEGLPLGQYTVVENIESAQEEGFNLLDSDTHSVVINVISDQEVQITNTYEEIEDEDNFIEEPSYGNLKITKVVTGSITQDDLAGKVFNFNIEGPEATQGKTYSTQIGDEVGKVTFDQSGIAQISIVESGVFRINDLPIGSYKITEVSDSALIDGYVVQINSDSEDNEVILTNGETSNITITNNYSSNKTDEEEPKAEEPEEPDNTDKEDKVTLGNLFIHKVVTGDLTSEISNTKTFTFSIVGPDSVRNQTYLTKIGNSTGTITFGENSIGRVQITGSNSLEILNLPIGSYSVIEDSESAQIEDYNLTIVTRSNDGQVSIDENNQMGSVVIENNYSEILEDEESTDNVTPLPEPDNGDTETPNLDEDKITFIKEQSVLRMNNVGFSQVGDGARTTEYIEVRENDIITYYLTVTNSGSTPITNVVITDPVPNGLELIQNSVTNVENLELNGNTLEWYIDEIGPNSQIEVEVQFKVIVPKLNEGSAWTNIAYLDYDQNTNSPIASNKVTIGYSPEQIVTTTDNSNSVASVTKTATNQTSTSTGSPKTGISDDIPVYILIVVISFAIGMRIYIKNKVK